MLHPVVRRAPDVPNWGEDLTRLKERGHYLDPFLAGLKKGAYVTLIERWGGAPRSGLTLKTDLFEEAAGGDAFLHTVAEIKRAVGMDLSPAIALGAKEREPRGLYLAADARTLPFASDSFALIISPSTLDHFVDPDDLGRSLQELARVLAPEGRLIITLDNRQNVADSLLRLANRLGWLPFYVGHSLTIRELRAALEAVGLEVTDTTAILHNPRLFAVAAKMLVNKIGWRPLIACVERALVAAQRLGKTPLRYRTGSFIAARADKRAHYNAKPG
ncbi:MAG: class I SAM-dependent methyltransferase [Chloroflexi bacterium]|nr:class I SAM-dependent methyltransferase [Chloroflexota bacterium]